MSTSDSIAVPMTLDEQGPDRVIVLASLPTITSYAHLEPVVRAAAQQARKKLAIVFVSAAFDGTSLLHSRATVPGGLDDYAVGPDESGPDGSPQGGGATWSPVQRLLTFAYVCASGAAHARGRLLLDIDVLLRGIDTPLLEEHNLGGTFDALITVSGGEPAPHVITL